MFSVRPKMGKANWALAGVNGVGIAAYLLLSAKTWLPPQERGQGLPVSGGDSIYWVMVALPVLLLFIVINVGWIIFRVTHKSKTKANGIVLPFGTIAFCWIVAIVFDGYMQS